MEPVTLGSASRGLIRTSATLLSYFAPKEPNFTSAASELIATGAGLYSVLSLSKDTLSLISDCITPTQNPQGRKDKFINRFIGKNVAYFCNRQFQCQGKSNNGMILDALLVARGIYAAYTLKNLFFTHK